MADPATLRRTIPQDARVSAWHTPDLWPLRRFDWPARPPIRGSMLFQCGRGDMFEKYLETFGHWHEAGWNITSFDWRGQGGSGRLSAEPDVGHVEDFGGWIADLGVFWRDWAATAPRPHVLVGHSMGGHLVLRALAEGVVKPDAAVLVAPMLGLHAPLNPWFGERVARMLGGVGDPARRAWRTKEKLGQTETRQQLLTHDPARYSDEIWWQQTCPDLKLGPPSWRWVIEAFRSTRELAHDPRLKTMRVPLLMLIAENDKLVSARAARRIAARLPDVRVLRFGKESAHEILREADPVRNRALGEIDMFLAARAPA